MPETLARQQFAFAAHLRDPQHKPAPADVEDRRMAIYRELFFNNISGFLARSFPVARKFFDRDGWQALMRDFYANYRCHTPLFTEFPREFVHYLESGATSLKGLPPFLPELAHYEWVEIALDYDPLDLETLAADRQGDLLDGRPLLSPLAWPLVYRWPVHQLRPDHVPAEPPAEPTCLLVYRNRADQVRFMQLNAVAQQLVLSLRADSQLTGRAALLAVAAALGHPDPEMLVEAGRNLLEKLLARDILLGTRVDGTAPAPDSLSS